MVAVQILTHTVPPGLIVVVQSANNVGIDSSQVVVLAEIGVNIVEFVAVDQSPMLPPDSGLIFSRIAPDTLCWDDQTGRQKFVWLRPVDPFTVSWPVTGRRRSGPQHHVRPECHRQASGQRTEHGGHPRRATTFCPACQR